MTTIEEANRQRKENMRSRWRETGEKDDMRKHIKETWKKVKREDSC